jgi:hypothetical protein
MDRIGRRWLARDLILWRGRSDGFLVSLRGRLFFFSSLLLFFLPSSLLFGWDVDEVGLEIGVIMVYAVGRQETDEMVCGC